MLKGKSMENLQEDKGKDLTPPKGGVGGETRREPPKPKPEPGQDEKTATVEVPRNVLETLIQKVDRMEKENLDKDKQFDDLIKDNEMLLQVADKARVQRYESQHADYTKNTANVSIFNGKIVTGWKMTHDNVGKNPNTKLWTEKQTVEITYEPDKPGDKEPTQEMDYSLFDALEKVEGTFIKDTTVTDEDGVHRMITLNVLGKEIAIDVRFLNQ